MSDDLMRLAEQVEKAAVAESHQWLAQAFYAICPAPEYGTSERECWVEKSNRFHRLLSVGAFLDAAMTLAGGLGGEVTFFKDGTAKAFLWQPYPLAVEAKAATPALALCAAALRALASSQEEPSHD